MTSALWAQVERSMREAAYASLDDDPQILLERDTYFTLDADLFYARLIGLEDEIVKDGLQVTRPEPVILAPIPHNLTRADFSSVSLCEIEPMRTAQYRLQSAHAVMEVAGQWEPPVPVRFDTQTVKVAYLRYRRRL